MILLRLHEVDANQAIGAGTTNDYYNNLDWMTGFKDSKNRSALDAQVDDLLYTKMLHNDFNKASLYLAAAVMQNFTAKTTATVKLKPKIIANPPKIYTKLRCNGKEFKAGHTTVFTMANYSILKNFPFHLIDDVCPLFEYRYEIMMSVRLSRGELSLFEQGLYSKIPASPDWAKGGLLGQFANHEFLGSSKFRRGFAEQILFPSKNSLLRDKLIKFGKQGDVKKGELDTPPNMNKTVFTFPSQRRIAALPQTLQFNNDMQARLFAFLKNA